MPIKAMTIQEIEQKKREIIEVASKTIVEEGFRGLSMRKLSKKLDMSAANLYNYFQNKEEIFIHILTEGFNLLFSEIDKSLDKTFTNPKEKLQAYLYAHHNFGVSHPIYYDLMFSSSDPHLRDFTDSEFSELAYETGNKSILYFNKLVNIIAECRPNNTQEQNVTMATQLFSYVHGMIHLVHARMLKQIKPNFDKTIKNNINDVIAML